MTTNWSLLKFNNSTSECITITFVVYSDNQVIVELFCFRNVYISKIFLGDNQFTKDIKAVSKGNAMFHGNRVQACSVTVKDNSIYFTGIVGAAMKNKVTVSLKHSYIL